MGEELAPGWAGESKASRTAYRALTKAITDRGSNCVGNSEAYSDYDEPPTAEEAELMCFGCPVRMECRLYAQAAKPTWGVFNGKVTDKHG